LLHLALVAPEAGEVAITARKGGPLMQPAISRLFRFDAVDGKHTESRVFRANLFLDVPTSAIPPLLQNVHVLIPDQNDAITWRRAAERSRLIEAASRKRLMRPPLDGFA
jgi:hypothetical protein